MGESALLSLLSFYTVNKLRSGTGDGARTGQMP